MTHQIITERLLDRLAKAARHFVTVRASERARRVDVLAAERYLATVLAEAEAAIEAAR